MRSRVLIAALLTTALACFNTGVAKADATEPQRQNRSACSARRICKFRLISSVSHRSLESSNMSFKPKRVMATMRKPRE